MTKRLSDIPPAEKLFVNQAMGDMTPLNISSARLNSASETAMNIGSVPIEDTRARMRAVGEPFLELGRADTSIIDDKHLGDDLAKLEIELEQSHAKALIASERGDRDSVIPLPDNDDEEVKLAADAAEMEKIATILSVVEEIENGLKVIAIFNAVGTLKDIEKMKVIVDNIFKAESDEEVLAICKVAGVSTEENNDDDGVEA